jgi:hypothetical protein
MVADSSSETVVALAKTLITLLQDKFPGWKRAYFRHEASETHTSSNGSYETGSGVHLLDALSLKPQFAQLRDLFGLLREQLTHDRQRFKVALLVVDSDFDFVIHYEFHSSDRWRITKLDGESGVPRGVPLS